MAKLSNIQPGNLLVVSTASLGSSPANVVLWPSAGGGGTGAPVNDVALSEFSGLTGTDNRPIAIDGVMITSAHTAATAITFYRRDGTTVLFTITVPANQVPIFIPLGQAGHGFAPAASSNVNGFACKTDHASTTFAVAWRRVLRNTGR